MQEGGCDVEKFLNAVTWVGTYDAAWMGEIGEGVDK